jgi:hypothetical protein
MVLIFLNFFLKNLGRSMCQDCFYAVCAHFGATVSILSAYSADSNALWHKYSKTLFPHL